MFGNFLSVLMFLKDNSPLLLKKTFAVVDTIP